MKLLTCHWWLTAVGCRFSANDCLYAHYDTGHHAEAPRQVVPGQPAVAGRNAHRRLHQANIENHVANLNLHNTRNMYPNQNVDPNMSMRGHSPNSSLADVTSVFKTCSNPSTPGIMIHGPNGHNMQNLAPPMFPTMDIIPNSPLQFATTNAANLENENHFLRTLVEQGGREKKVMVTTLETLQAENQGLSPHLSLFPPHTH